MAPPVFSAFEHILTYAPAPSRQTLHFKFINQLCAVATQMNMPRDHEHSVYNFHSDLFLSGLERIIMVSRPSVRSIFSPPRPSPIYQFYLVIGFKTDLRAARNLRHDSFFIDWAKGVNCVLPNFASRDRTVRAERWLGRVRSTMGDLEDYWFPTIRDV